jgi:TolB-like protein
MTDRDDRLAGNAGPHRPEPLDAVAAYVAQDAAGDSDSAESRRGPADADPAQARALATFARCDAAIALAPKLVASPDLAFAFAEARQLARSLPGRRAGSDPAPARARWYERPTLAWSVAACATGAAIIVAIMQIASTPVGQAVAPPPIATTVLRPAPRVYPADVENRLAKVEPVVLIANGVPVDGRSLAVLPFASETAAGDGDTAGTDATADALYARLMQQLGAVPGLIVIDPGAASAFANSELSPEQIALFLGVRAVVEGQVTASGDTIRLGLRFTDAAGDGVAVYRSFAGPAEPAGAIERDITTSLLDAMSGGEATGFDQAL